jgi:hypothetical protein
MTNILSPSHYQLKIDGKLIQVKDIIDSLNCSYHVGTAIAYILRAGRKQPDTFTEDINKAIVHLGFECDRIVNHPYYYPVYHQPIVSIYDISTSLDLKPDIVKALSLLFSFFDDKQTYLSNLQQSITHLSIYENQKQL